MHLLTKSKNIFKESLLCLAMKKSTWMFVWIAVIAVVGSLAVYGSMKAMNDGIQLSPKVNYANSLQEQLDEARQANSCNAGPSGCTCTGDLKCDSESDKYGASSNCWSTDQNNKGKCTRMKCKQTINTDGSALCSCKSESGLECPASS
jgi:type II secretory pathway pseudopilin PulG